MRSRSTSHSRLGSPGRLLVVLITATLAVSCQSSTSEDSQARDRSVNHRLDQRMEQRMDRMGQHMGGGMGPGMMRRTYFAQYGTSTHAYKPRRLNPSVDGSLFVTGMRWELWNAHRARGTGTAHVNDCDPDCADGHYSEHRVTVRLGRPRELCDARFFTSLRLHGPGYHQRSHSSGVGCR